MVHTVTLHTTNTPIYSSLPTRTGDIFSCHRVLAAPVAGHLPTVPVYWTVGTACLLDQQTHQCHLVSGEHQLSLLLFVAPFHQTVCIICRI